MRKITPFLWFENRAEEAVALYTSLFEGSKTLNVARGPGGDVMSLSFELAGEGFHAMNGGRERFSPAISFFVHGTSREEIDRLWEKLGEGGMALMELDSYPWSERYGWLQDRFGVSWQLMLADRAEKIVPSLMFVGEQAGKAEEAMQQYTALFEDSGIESVERYTEDDPDTTGTVKYASFRLAGQPFVAMDSGMGHPFTFTSATSLFVSCEDQEEIDRLWAALSEGGEEVQCGWLKDRYGVSWQIVPSSLGKLLGDPDRERSRRAMEAMLRMQKLDIRALEEAAEGK